MGTMGFAARGWRRGGGLRVGGVSKVEPWAYYRVKRVEDVFSKNHAGGVVFFCPNGRCPSQWDCWNFLALSKGTRIFCEMYTGTRERVGHALVPIWHCWRRESAGDDRATHLECSPHQAVRSPAQSAHPP